ncbi:MAG: hypothetical protein H6711_15900 [Myxococcales bacterium]|nr:hypothetical protein [Myxococcales bacterium]
MVDEDEESVVVTGEVVDPVPESVVLPEVDEVLEVDAVPEVEVSAAVPLPLLLVADDVLDVLALVDVGEVVLTEVPVPVAVSLVAVSSLLQPTRAAAARARVREGRFMGVSNSMVLTRADSAQEGFHRPRTPCSASRMTWW